MLLYGASITRYYALFWKKHHNETASNTSNNDLKTFSFTKRQWRQWAIISVADIAGSVAG